MPARRAGLFVVMALLALSYWEPIELAGVKFAMLWKLCAVLLVVPGILASSRRGLRLFRTRTSLFLAAMVAAALCASAVDPEPTASLRVAAQRLFVLAVVVYAGTPSRRTMGVSCLLWVPFALVVTALPFVVGILEPIGEAYRYSEIYGFASPGFVGVFQNAHAASLAMGLGVVLCFWRLLAERSVRRIVVHVGVLTALAVLAFRTYARTGLAVGLAGSLVLLFLIGRAKVWRVLALVLGVVILFGAFAPDDLTPMVNRLLGETIYSTDFDSRSAIDRASSGRLGFILQGLGAWQEGGTTAWVVGLGYGGMEQALAARTGYRIPTHNGFADAIVANGVLGLIALLGFLWSLSRDIATQRESRMRALGFALFAGWVTFLLVQGGEMPLHYLLLVVPFGTTAAGIRDHEGPGV